MHPWTLNEDEPFAFNAKRITAMEWTEGHHHRAAQINAGIVPRGRDQQRRNERNHLWCEVFQGPVGRLGDGKGMGSPRLQVRHPNGMWHGRALCHGRRRGTTIQAEGLPVPWYPGVPLS